MFATTRKVFALLDRRERIHLSLLLLAVLVTAFLEMVSVAAVLPFLSVAADPTLIETNPWLAWAYEALGFSDPISFLILLGALAVLAVVLANTWIGLTQFAKYRFAFGCMHQLGVRLLRCYGDQPYAWFLRRNSADLSKNVLNEVEEVAVYVLVPGLTMATKAIVALAIIGLLVAFDPALALTVALVLGGAYGAIHFGTRRYLTRIGAQRVAANTARYKSAGEFLGAIKEVKLLGREPEFLHAFVGPSASWARNRATALIIGQTPRYALEGIAVGGILVIALTLLARGGALQQVIPVLGLYAFAGFRLMPNLQQVFVGVTQMRFGAPAVDNLHREMAGSEPPPGAERPTRRGNAHATPLPRTNGKADEVLALRERLELDRITFTYPGHHKPALEDVSLALEANTTLGIMGSTGAGKTTLVDIILGLLRPEQGEIRIDGVPLSDDNLRAWQDGIGYVPQHIYLADDTIARNIAFGVAPDAIDMAAVKRAARLAQIHDFVAQELPESYEAVAGERGIRLSGGQRQRIGIARALYHDPKLLVFDEATSALDHDTEAAVMEAIHALAGTRSIVVIAHRVSTLSACDALVRLQHGRVGQSGSYSELLGAGERHGPTAGAHDAVPGAAEAAATRAVR